MINRYNIKVVIKSTIEKIFKIQLLQIVIYTNSKLLSNCMIKLSNTQEKHLIVDLKYLEHSYE